MTPARAERGLRPLAQLFLKLGVIAFGGPAAHIAMMEDEVVGGPRLRESPWTAAFLDAVNVAALALMAAVTVELGRATLTSWPAWVIAIAGGIAALGLKINAAWIVLGGAIAGWRLAPWTV